LRGTAADTSRSLFDDPNYHERVLYNQYWQKKLRSNKDLSFPDTLVNDVAKLTEKFSFAFLKEAL
jgi:transitional endoplasmic reticulum ATPase